MNETIRIALIGCGFFARNQLHGWQAIEGVEVVALCDRDPARLQRFRDFADEIFAAGTAR